MVKDRVTVRVGVTLIACCDCLTEFTETGGELSCSALPVALPF